METVIHSSKLIPKGKFLFIKKIVSCLALSPLVGRMIGTFYSYKIPHRKKIIEVPSNSDPVIISSLFWNCYEGAEIRFVDEFLTDNFDVIELGSSIGGVASQIASILNGKRKLICLEANKNLIPFLRSNLISNSLDQYFSIINGAIDYSGSTQVSFKVNNNSLSSSIGIADNAENVVAYTLSSILRTEEICKYVLVSDIEGAEVAIFVEDFNALANCLLLIIELHDTTYKKIFYTVEDMISLIQNNTRLSLQARYAEVCVFSQKK